MKNQKSFKEQYKEIKTASLIGIIAGLIFTLIGIIQMTTNMVDLPSILLLTFGSCFFCYSFIWFFLYWKFNKYQKNQQTIPKQFRIISAMFLIFYLTLFQLKENTKTYRQYILLKEIRFYVLIWIFICVLTIMIEFYAIQQGKIFWLLISLLIINIIWITDLIIMIFIWKYKGINNKLLKILTIITLNYHNYQLYKTIIKLNSNEKATN